MLVYPLLISDHAKTAKPTVTKFCALTPVTRLYTLYVHQLSGDMTNIEFTTY